MKILFIIEYYHPHIGGVENVFKNLTEGLVKKGFEVSVLTMLLDNTKKNEIISGVKITRINSFKSRYLFTFLAIPTAMKLAKKSDLIHTTTYNATLAAKIAGIFNKKKVIITIHEILGRNWFNLGISKIKSYVYFFIEKIILSLNFNKYIAVSNSTKRQIIDNNIPSKRIITIHNGINYNHWKKNNRASNNLKKRLNLENNYLLIFYGRPGISKGLFDLVKAIPKVIKDIPNILLYAIVSHDSDNLKEVQKVKDWVKYNQMDKYIEIVPSVKYKDLPIYVNMGDLIVIPSITEGFGFVVVESCALNKIVIASDTTSIPEVISGDYLLFEPKNSEDIAKKIVKAHKGNYITIEKKKFEISTNIEKHIKLYQLLN